MVAPGGRQRWEFMLQPGETRDQIKTPGMIRELLAPRCKPEDITIERTAVRTLLATSRLAGGDIVQLRHSAQGWREVDIEPGGHSLKDMSNQLVPSAAPVGWIAVVRPDRTVLARPADALDDIVRELLRCWDPASPRVDGLPRALRCRVPTSYSCFFWR